MLNQVKDIISTFVGENDELFSLKALGTLLGLGIVMKVMWNRRKPSNKKLRYPSNVYYEQDLSKEKVSVIFKQFQKSFDKNCTSQIYDDLKGRWDYHWRMQQLYGLRDFIQENRQAIYEAAKKDIGRTQGEMVLEIGAMLGDIDHMIYGLRCWMKPVSAGTPLWMMPSTSKVIFEPLGVCLVLGTWNYSFITALLPAAGAIAAGNPVIIKPSELAPAQAELLARLLPKYVDSEACVVLQGGPMFAKMLVDDFDWGKVCYTGGGKIGALIGASCAARLVPCCLELGGKSPTVILDDADLTVSFRRIVQGKFVNCGKFYAHRKAPRWNFD
jgi:acyl-CoA reductase-like NAD-dependent aldehyde dehydrogenase